MTHPHHYPLSRTERRRTNLLTSVFIILVIMMLLWITLGYFTSAKTAAMTFIIVSLVGVITMYLMLKTASPAPEHELEQPGTED